MASRTSSVGLNFSSCQSNPHQSTTSTVEDADMRAQRLAPVSQPGTDNVTDRLVNGTGTASDHRASLEARIAALTATINNPTTTNGN
ncbi:uncharacterized protein F4807DRAFT_424175 [Annulohypoxylon truncatum]|uniref:uncharacterized protein n=1 Tax=Annulohypoxylon truncatum TaxID=327061 RepID=UPI002008D9C6|nr:uncharacterized protein F4807DRAFT_424175 [Annulohypoxylon truncatum]KAI1210189.1 hypothetical protein F4807DRAFT_424175 [Annulohypoxylon truncatum]